MSQEKPKKSNFCLYVLLVAALSICLFAVFVSVPYWLMLFVSASWVATLCFFIISIYERPSNKARRAQIPLSAYPVMFTLPIFFLAVLHIILPSCFISIFNFKLFKGITEYKVDFIVIFICISSIIAYLQIKKYNTRDNPFRYIKSPSLFLTVLCTSIILFFAYIPLSGVCDKYIKGSDCKIVNIEQSMSKGIGFNSAQRPVAAFVTNSSDSGAEFFAVLAAVVAACATIYNIQRTLKQESTKNRQDWITSVRFEAAKLIAIVDKIKLYNSLQRQPNAYSYAEQITELYTSLLDSCAKLRLLLNPKDLIAPILIVQLDAITNYITAHNSRGKEENDSKNIKDCVFSINEIDLRESFMPWVQILLKVEWERVKDILESKEESSEGYYSNDIYMERWKGTDLYKYGVDVKAIVHAIEISDDKNNTERKNISEKYVEKLHGKSLFSVLFPGFFLAEKTKEQIKSNDLFKCYLSKLKSTSLDA